MNPNYLVRKIHIGRIITNVIKEKNNKISDVSLKMGLSNNTIETILKSESIDILTLLKLCKVLKYDFFRLYSSHLMLHHGISNTMVKKSSKINVEGINIRKNVYTKEIIVYLVSKVRKKELTPSQVIHNYGIPKTTFYKWLQKYPND